VHALRKALKSKDNQRIVLIDKAPHHVRKVLLVQAAVSEANMTVSWNELFPDVQVVQGEVFKIDSQTKQVCYRNLHGEEAALSYDCLVTAFGSVVKEQKIGVTLSDLAAAERIRKQVKENVRKAFKSAEPKERARFLSATVIGAGISGIETAAELASFMRNQAEAQGTDSDEVKVYLVNSGSRLFPEGPEKLSRRLEQELNKSGVFVVHGHRAIHEENGWLQLSNQKALHTELSIFTPGLAPNPHLKRMGLPVTECGQVITDASYRVEGLPDVYSIGDCAFITDPRNNKADTMTCKEGSMQAQRLGKVILADMQNRPAPVHKAVPPFYCFGLGPDRGMAWLNLWGFNLILSGGLGKYIRMKTWDAASLIKR